MRKSGLQKQIASIFTDVPVPSATDPRTARLPERPQETDDDSNPAGDTVQPQTPAAEPMTAPAMTAVQTESVHTPAVTPLRPRPLPKLDIKPEKKKTGRQTAQQFRQALFGSANGMDSRQKKMTLLVGILTVVLGAVLVVTLGGPGQKKAPADPKGDDPAPARQAAAPSSQAWQTPEPLPAQLRDPMNPRAEETELQNPKTEETGWMVVKGIVYSKDNPTAIIDGKIVGPGESVKGVTIVAIHKDSVEFEKDGSRWTQQVEP